MTCSDLVLSDVEVEGALVDVYVRHRMVDAILPHATTSVDRTGAAVVDGRGGALLPGLHDHHLHLLATAAARSSVDCSGLTDRAALGRALRSADGSWIRGVGYDERTAGVLDRHALDAMVPDRPVRVQHRTGALWILNSAAIDRVRDVLDDSADVERDAEGSPNGRLWRYDDRLRSALPATATDLRPVGRELLRYGVTGVTDATPDLAPGWFEIVEAARSCGALPQRITVLGHPSNAALPAGLASGPWKLHLRDHDLPSPQALERAVREQHERGRPVAVHCVTPEALLITLAALEAAGPLEGDRIEHASVVLPGTVERLAATGARVVTQPAFLWHRGDAYLREVAEGEQPYLYPYRSLVAAGVRVAPSSDAPQAPADPWLAIASATTRRTPADARVAPDEAVSAQQVLDGFLSAPDDPGGRPRRVEIGAPADLCLLDVPLARALAEVPRNPVRMTILDGQPYDGGLPLRTASATAG